MATPRVTIDELPEQLTAEDTDYLVVQDAGTSKKMSVATLKTGVSDLLTAHLIDPTDAHDATAISTTTSGSGIDGVTVQAQLGQLATGLATTTTTAAGIATHLADTDDAHDASAISAAADTTLSGTTVQAQLTSAGALIDAIEGGVAGPAGPAGPGVAVGGLVGQVLTKVSAADYDTNWQTPTGGGGGGGAVSDGDHGDIVVTDTGVTWTLDPTVVTAAAKTVLDDTTTTAMRTTLGAQATDVDLDAIAANTTSGLLTRTGTGTATGRTIQGQTNKITVTNGSGVSGDPTISVGADVYVAAGTDVPVPDGGTGRSTSGTAYGLLAAGTTAVGAHQTVTPGTSGHLLVSAGASALPAFRAGVKGDVGLSNVDNTADVSKPVFTSSTAGIVPASGGGSVNFLRADGTFAVPAGGGGGIAGITVAEGGSTYSDVNKLDFQPGFTITESPADEANISLDLTEYTGGALPIAGGGTGGITAAAARTALDVQQLDSDLTAIAGNSTNGIYARTGTGTLSARTITGTTNRIGVTDGDGISGNPTLDIGSDVVTLTGTQTLTNKTISQAQITSLTSDLATKVPTTRTLTGTAPVAIGGVHTAQDLSANRTISVLTSSDTAAGVVELATTAEVVTGTDTSRAVTAAGVAAVTCPTPNAQTGTTYTLVLTDHYKLVTLSNAAAITLTVPPNASVAFPVGARIDLAQIGAGQVTVTPGSGVTVNATPSLLLRTQYSAVSLYKTATNTWLALGDFEFPEV